MTARTSLTKRIVSYTNVSVLRFMGTFYIQSYATSSNLQIKIFHIHCIYPPSVLVKNIKQSDDSELLIGESCYYCQNTQNSHSLQLHTFLQKFFDVKENNNFVLLHKNATEGEEINLICFCDLRAK